MLELFGDDEDDDDPGLLPTGAYEGITYAKVVSGLESIGGGRGIVASKNLDAGCLLLAEKPIMAWEFDLSDPDGIDGAVRQLLSNPEILAVCRRSLHPQRYDEIGTDEVIHIRAHLLGEERMISICKELQVREEGVVHLVSVLKHNGLVSGLYEHLSMINHSCVPNCIVFIPTPSSLGMAEVWTTKSIAEGEECVICYCPSSSTLVLSQEQNSKSIRSYLSEQHGFECACIRCGQNEDLGYLDSDFEEELLHWEREMIMAKLYSPAEVADVCRQSIKWVSKYHQHIVGGAHRGSVSSLLMGRASKLAVAAASTGMEMLQGINEYQSKLKYFALKFLIHNIHLEKLQIEYLGDKHPDLARTYHDLAEVIESLLVHDVEYVQLHFLPLELYSIASVKDLKAKSQFFKKQGLAIQDLYNRRKKYPSSLITGRLSTVFWGS